LGALTQAQGSPLGGPAQSVMFDSNGAYMAALQSTVTVYSVNGGNFKAVASATPGQNPARVAMLQK
jgi:hypothetical protein